MGGFECFWVETRSTHGRALDVLRLRLQPGLEVFRDHETPELQRDDEAGEEEKGFCGQVCR